MVETTYHIPSCPVSVALLADFHNGGSEPILSSLNEHRPDLVAIAGDLVYGSVPRSAAPDTDPELVMKAQVNVLPLLSGCASIAPTFVSLGNHEWMLNSEDMHLIESTGAVVLDNRWTQFTKHGENESRINIGGLSSGYVEDYRRFLTSVPKDVLQKQRYITNSVFRECGINADENRNDHTPDTAFLNRLPSGYKILLCHHPEYIDLLPDSINLVLSGHAHGGQWRFYDPIHRTWRGVFAPGQGLFPKLTEGGAWRYATIPCHQPGTEQHDLDSTVFQ